MGAVWAPQSLYMKERATWEQPRPHAKFPFMVYSALRSPKGKIVVQDVENPGFAQACQKIVNDDRELEKAIADGWRIDPNDAIARAELMERNVSDAAAERYYTERRMSEMAQREAERRDPELTDGVRHVPVIPETPIPPKPAVTVRYCDGPTKTGKPCKFKALKGGTRCKKHSD